MYVFFLQRIPLPRRPGLNPKIKHGVTDPRGSWLRWTYATHERETVKFKCVVAGSGIEETGHVRLGNPFLRFRSVLDLVRDGFVLAGTRVCHAWKPRKYVAALITVKENVVGRRQDVLKAMRFKWKWPIDEQWTFLFSPGNGKQPIPDTYRDSFQARTTCRVLYCSFHSPFCSGR